MVRHCINRIFWAVSELWCSFNKNSATERTSPHLSMLVRIKVNFNIDIGEEFRGPLEDDQHVKCQVLSFRNWLPILSTTAEPFHSRGPPIPQCDSEPKKGHWRKAYCKGNMNKKSQKCKPDKLTYSYLKVIGKLACGVWVQNQRDPLQKGQVGVNNRGCHRNQICTLESNRVWCARPSILSPQPILTRLRRQWCHLCW